MPKSTPVPTKLTLTRTASDEASDTWEIDGSDGVLVADITEAAAILLASALRYGVGREEDIFAYFDEYLEGVRGAERASHSRVIEA